MHRESIGFGRKDLTSWIVMNFSRNRGMVKFKNLAKFDVTYLEDIPLKFDGSQPGIVLVHRDWTTWYAVKEREDWDEEKYFSYANTLIKDHDGKKRLR